LTPQRADPKYFDHQQHERGARRWAATLLAFVVWFTVAFGIASILFDVR
jgi:hypothetical protein